MHDESASQVGLKWMISCADRVIRFVPRLKSMQGSYHADPT